MTVAKSKILPNAARKSLLPSKPIAQLATLVHEAPSGPLWLHEQKFDGYRMFCRIRAGRVQFISRNQQDWTTRLKSLAAAALELPVNQALLDGEVVVLDSKGISSFQRLQNAFREGRTSQLIYFVFDLLHVDGFDLMGVPLDGRKQVLESIVLPAKSKSRRVKAKSGANQFRLSEHLVGSGPALHKKMCKMDLEGIISKRRDAPYVGGRSGSWLKAKCRLEQELVIGGFTDPAGSRVGFGALLLGYYGPDGKLAYAGRVGTGFDTRRLNDLAARLKKLEQRQSPFVDFPIDGSSRGIHWVAPKLVGQIQFSNWTDDNLLRQAAFLGLREDKPAREVKRELAR